MKQLLLITNFIFLISLTARAQRPLESQARFDGFYTLSLDKVLDTIAVKCHARIIYDKDVVDDYNVVDHFFNESLKEVLGNLCDKYGFHYWVEPDQTIYIIRSPGDLAHLKRLAQVKKLAELAEAEKPVSAPVAMTPIERYLSLDNAANTVKPQPPAAVTAPTPATGPVETVSGRFNLSGRVVDASNGESLPSAIVRVQHTSISAVTNADGYFTLLGVPADTCLLDVTYIGYQQDNFRLTRENVKQKITIGLFSSINSLNEVVISDKKSQGVMSTDKRRVSVLQISPSKLDELPNIGEKDILRSFQLMPGISGSNESSSGAYVRGGTPDQNLVLFDGFTVYQVDHLYGFFSAFNSNAVKDVTLYKGGFSAKYGGRLSSVTDIVGKEGNSKEENIGGDLSLLSANIYVEKPLNDKSTLLLAFRRSYQGPLYKKIFDSFNSSTTAATGNNTGAPGGRPGGGGGGFGGSGPTVTTPTSSFYDLNAKYTYSPDEKNRFSWSIYQGNDNLDNSKNITLPFSTASSLSMTDKTTYGNLGSSLKWSSQWNSKLYSNTLLSYSTYHSNRDNSTHITVQDADGNDEDVGTGTFEKNNLKDFSLKSDWEWQATSKAKVLFGTFASRQSVSYEYSENDTSKLIDQHTKAFTGGVYAELEADPTDKLQIKPGLRTTYYDQTGKPYLEPRLSATYTVTDHFTLKAATGKFYQFTNRVIREDILSGSRDFWVLSNNSTIPVSSANHYTAGFSYERGQFLLDIEGYYKTLDGLSEYSQRETGNSRQGTVSLEEHFYTGTGYTKGIEVLFQKTRGKYTGWISYTLAQATNHFDIYGGDFPANQDTRHEFKTVHLYHFGRWSFSTTWIFATGKPYTAPLTSYTVNNYTGNSQTFLTISAKNSERLPSYHRLDAAVTYDLIKIDSRKIGSIGFSMFNIYNRANIWYKQYTIVNNQVITSNVNYLGFTPNITLSLKWK
ncbi:MAG: hypothetical protein JWR38_2425 [Mucilaginibacter sp.]|nr:hypothetical protein [Mucilaginibacter sp.]